MFRDLWHLNLRLPYVITSGDGFLPQGGLFLKELYFTFMVSVVSDENVATVLELGLCRRI